MSQITDTFPENMQLFLIFYGTANFFSEAVVLLADWQATFEHQEIQEIECQKFLKPTGPGAGTSDTGENRRVQHQFLHMDRQYKVSDLTGLNNSCLLLLYFLQGPSKHL